MDNKIISYLWNPWTLPPISMDEFKVPFYGNTYIDESWDR